MRAKKGKEGQGWKGTILKYIKGKEKIPYQELIDILSHRRTNGATRSQISGFMAKQGYRKRDIYWVNICH